jgi:Ca2+-binding EF-hand superfamily protein
MASELTPADIIAAKEVFVQFDKDKDEVINQKDLSLTMKAIERILSDAEAIDMIKEIDADGNGVIDFPEFLSMIHSKKSPLWQDAYRTCLRNPQLLYSTTTSQSSRKKTNKCLIL